MKDGTILELYMFCFGVFFKLFYLFAFSVTGLWQYKSQKTFGLNRYIKGLILHYFLND